MSSFFKHNDNLNGNISEGIIPERLHKILHDIKVEFKNKLSHENKIKTAYHEWCTKLEPNLQKNIDIIMNDKFWLDICNDNKCEMTRIKEMDEIYYANPPNSISKNLYGAIGNYGVHSDGMFDIKNLSVYRILIGLTDNNDNITYFIDHGYGRKLQKNHFVIFDFDKSRHQVLINNDNVKSNYRIVLKLHFMTYKKDYFSDYYINCIKQIYIRYLKMTRYFMDNGTNPSNLKEFCFGIICHIIGSELNMVFVLLIMIIVWFILYYWYNNIYYSFSIMFITSFVLFFMTIFYHYLIYIYKKELN